MRIKTITCHRVDNHGANLQAYGLMHYLENQGQEVEIIDYYPEYFRTFRPLVCSTPRYASNILLKTAYICVKFPGRLKSYWKYRVSLRKKNFELFREKYYKITREYRSYEELKEYPPEADLYIAGSDQIWNTMMHNGHDPSFYLEFTPKDTVSATYAASFSVSEIPQDVKNIVKHRIEKIDFVAIREKSALTILEELGITKGQVVLDPVFLLSKEEWLKIENSKKFKEPYVLVYDFENSETIKNAALEYSNRYGLKIYSLYHCSYCDCSFEDEGPDMFLSLIHHAQFILSNSFHATAFALIYEKEFLVIRREEGINSRMVDLLVSVGLEERIQNKLIEMEEINYADIHIKLKKQIENSKQYLNDVLECCVKKRETRE